MSAAAVITGGHIKQDQILSVKIGKYIGFGVYRTPYLQWPSVIAVPVLTARLGPPALGRLDTDASVSAPQVVQNLQLIGSRARRGGGRGQRLGGQRCSPE